MKKWITAIAMLVAATAMFALPQEGGRPRRGPGGPPPSFTVMFADKLALTAEQKEQIAAIEKTAREENAQFFDSSRLLMDEMRAAREADDTAKLESLKRAMDANRGRMKEIRDAEIAKIVAVLTAEQRAQFEALQAEHDARRHEPPPRD